MLKKLARALGLRLSRRGTTFQSFVTPLTRLCEARPPKRVLEFGPGTSTRVILEHSAATIVSIEESREWYERYAAEFPPERVRVLHKTPPWDLAELDALGGPFDLIFVDGGDRVAEMKHSPRLLAAGGLVYLHDAHRDNYEPGIRTYPHVYFPDRHSCILTQDEDVWRRVRELLPQDWSCRCRYCDTPERQTYLAQFHDEAADRPTRAGD